MMNILSVVGTESSSTLIGTFYENTIFIIGFLMVLAIIGGKITEKLNFPKVTGYILMGVLVGPSLMSIILTDHFIETVNHTFDIDFKGIISLEKIHAFKIIREVAIGFIGYTIGLELKFSKISKTGKQVTIITFAQAFVTAVFVTVAVILYMSATGKPNALTYGLILGAIATATAPAPIIAIVKNYRTKGPVTDTLLPLVAMDDAIGIMLFAIMLAIGTVFLGIDRELTLAYEIFEPIKEIFLSIAIGVGLGYILSFLVKRFNRDSEAMLLMMILATLLCGIGIGQVVHVSEILLPMSIGAVLSNTVTESFEHRLTKNTDLFGAPIMLAFFMLAGLELDLSTLPIVGVLGLIYITVRVVGKVLGSSVSAKAVKAAPTVTKYLGWTLIPQAGVAINMAIATNTHFEDIIGYEHIGAEIMTIILAATVIYEVFGLIIVKASMSAAGEIDAQHASWEK